MGMFDTIICEYPLELPEDDVVDIKNFQTKDLDNTLDKYTITKEGRLIHEKYDTEEVPEKERPYYGTDKWEGIGKFIGCIRHINQRLVDTNHHGDIIFYTSSVEKKQWIEYRARFTNGTVEFIERIKYPITDHLKSVSPIKEK